jgi:3-phenylpropionate/trans-cinnamate dioxygenase ferredoxin subunit|tara:strand:- start:218 stop:526 length:309 start_codon:yes stop_codon:yes gene_type:complete
MNTIKLSEFENSPVSTIDINGTTVAVFKVDEDYYAIQNMCSHAEADLADGEVYDCKVECPLHGAEFDLKTGEALTLPATKPVSVFRTEIDGDTLIIKENSDA